MRSRIISAPDSDLDQDADELAPLTPEKSPNKSARFANVVYGADGSGQRPALAAALRKRGAAGAEPTSSTSGEAPAAARTLTAGMTRDLRQSRRLLLLKWLFVLQPLLDLLLCLLPSSSDSELYNETSRDWARTAQMITQVFTLLLALYCLAVLRAWQGANPRFAAVASAQFVRLPEYMAIAIFLDVGKVAYPAGARVTLAALLITVRMVALMVLLAIAFTLGLRRSTLDRRRGLPEIVRALLKLESDEAKPFEGSTLQVGRPLTVGLLEKLILFLGPKQKAHEGGGLARNSSVPLVALLLVLTAASVVVDFRRLVSTQEPLFGDAAAAEVIEASNATLSGGAVLPPPMAVFLVVISGMGREVGEKILAPAFAAGSNPLCDAEDGLCESWALEAELPTTSLANWLSVVTGTAPATHGVLGNLPLPPLGLDTVVRQASLNGVHAAVSASPWMLNPVKADLPLLSSDGRVSSAADGTCVPTPGHRAPHHLLRTTRCRARRRLCGRPCAATPRRRPAGTRRPPRTRRPTSTSGGTAWRSRRRRPPPPPQATRCSPRRRSAPSSCSSSRTWTRRATGSARATTTRRRCAARASTSSSCRRRCRRTRCSSWPPTTATRRRAARAAARRRCASCRSSRTTRASPSARATTSSPSSARATQRAARTARKRSAWPTSRRPSRCSRARPCRATRRAASSRAPFARPTRSGGRRTRATCCTSAGGSPRSTSSSRSWARAS